MSDPQARRAAEDVAEATTSEDLEAVAPERSDLPPLRDMNAFATFDDSDPAQEAVVALERAGIDGTHISALALDEADHVESGAESTGAVTAEHDAEMLSEVGSGVGRGAAFGAVAGALGGTAVALAIPGVGLALGAGVLAVAAGGAVAGTGVGGFAGAVSTTPASQGWEQAFIDLDAGRIVIGVHSDDPDTHDTALSVLANSHALSIRQLDADGQPI